MKQLTQLVAMIIGVGSTHLSFGADWTPYLKGMQDSCNYGDELTNILSKNTAMPKELKADIVRHTTVVNNRETNDQTINLILKNATAFGYPINKITYKTTDYTSLLAVHFKTTDFTKSISNFTIKVGNQNQKAGVKKAWVSSTSDEITSVTIPQKIDGKYYDYESLFMAIKDPNQVYITDETGWSNVGAAEYGTYLTFDKKTKTISCNSS